MKTKLLLLSFLLPASMLLSAQEVVDKATVTAQANAAQSAEGDLKKIDTGEKNWKFSGVVGLNASATALVNWAAGGKNNVNGVAFARMRLLYHKNAIAWDTNLDTEIGYSYIDQEEDPLQKSTDKINLVTKFGWEFHKTWYLTVLGGFRSQYAHGYSYVTGYNPSVSKWLAPSYTDISVGIDWKPNDIFTIYLSPLAGRITTAYVSQHINNKVNAAYQAAYADGTLDPASYDPAYNYSEYLKLKYGVVDYQYDEVSGTYKTVAADKNVNAQFGLSFKGGINYTYKDLKIITTVGLFTPYKWDNRKDERGKYIDHQRFGNFDVDWDFAISYQFLKVLNVTLSTSLKYYNGVLIDKTDKNGVTTSTERVQFQSILGLGIGYSF